MPFSGIKPSDDVKRKFDRIKTTSKKEKKLLYCVLKFSDDQKTIEVDYDQKYYDKHLTYTSLIELLPENQPRYVIYDFPHLNKDGGKVNSLVFVSWFPQGTPVKLRFLAGSTSRAVATTLGFSGKQYIEGDCASDIDEKSVCENNGWTILPDDQRDALSDGRVEIDPED